MKYSLIRQTVRYMLLVVTIFAAIWSGANTYIMHKKSEWFHEFCKTAKLVELKDGRKVFVSPKYVEEHADEIEKVVR